MTEPVPPPGPATEGRRGPLPYGQPVPLPAPSELAPVEPARPASGQDDGSQAELDAPSAGAPPPAAPAGAAAAVAAAPEADGQWHRLHPITPVIKGWKVLAVLLVIVVQQRSDALFSGRGLPGGLELLAAAGFLLIAALVSAAWSWLAGSSSSSPQPARTSERASTIAASRRIGGD